MSDATFGGVGARQQRQDALIRQLQGLASAKRFGFSAFRSTSQALSGAFARNVIVFTGEDWDPDGVYNTANGRFTPAVNGTYRIHGYASQTAAATTRFLVELQKNGAKLKRFCDLAGNAENQSGGSVLVDGLTTDYFEIVVLIAGAATNTAADGALNYFQAELISGL